MNIPSSSGQVFHRTNGALLTEEQETPTRMGGLSIHTAKDVGHAVILHRGFLSTGVLNKLTRVRIFN